MTFLFKSHSQLIPSTTLAIGNFDGLHLGHQKLFEKLAETGSSPAVLTFWPNPKQYFNKKFIPMHSLEEKIFNLKKYGIDQIFVLNFDQNISEMNADDFINNIILDELLPDKIIIGEDFKFGKNANYNAQYLQKYLANKIMVEILPLENKPFYSSSRVRLELKDGNFSILNQLLGRKYSFSGIGVKNRNLIQIKRNLKLEIKDITFTAVINYDNNSCIATAEVKDGICFLNNSTTSLIGKKLIITPD